MSPKRPFSKTPRPAPSLAREILDKRVVGGKPSQLANYSDLFERATDGIAFVDFRNHEILETNGAFRTLLGADAAPEGCAFFELFPEADPALAAKCFDGSEGSFETTSGGRTIVFEAARVWLADYCEVLQVLARDVTRERERRERLERESLTDEMTGLSNFRAFRGRLALEHERAEKKRSAYCAIFLDVDHFKHFNDRNGHPAGDDALRQIAALLRETCGRSEFAARYGGEEFIVLGAGMDLAAGLAFAERTRRAIASHAFPHGEGQPLGRVTVSIGVAVRESGVSAEAVLARADQALYASKRSGRNQVTAFHAGLPDSGEKKSA